MEKSRQYLHIQSVMEIGQVPPSSAALLLWSGSGCSWTGRLSSCAELRMVVFHRTHLDLKPVSYRKKGHSAALGASWSPWYHSQQPRTSPSSQSFSNAPGGVRGAIEVSMGAIRSILDSHRASWIHDVQWNNDHLRGTLERPDAGSRHSRRLHQPPASPTHGFYC